MAGASVQPAPADTFFHTYIAQSPSKMRGIVTGHLHIHGLRRAVLYSNGKEVTATGRPLPVLCSIGRLKDGLTMCRVKSITSFLWLVPAEIQAIQCPSRRV
ncbi:hypothetical protein RvY_16381 [Ramazzottius varieornatus]|uniref:Uncharacterized protein n=1 Tax=Ramazzottius varieornatus TaxID=947166 RepID=A0A1D1VY78_RAMVA|nr:hypothetical protein RvY_16381 [Ramazzottius varieornatus]